MSEAARIGMYFLVGLAILVSTPLMIATIHAMLGKDVEKDHH